MELVELEAGKSKSEQPDLMLVAYGGITAEDYLLKVRSPGSIHRVQRRQRPGPALQFLRWTTRQYSPLNAKPRRAGASIMRPEISLPLRSRNTACSFFKLRCGTHKELTYCACFALLFNFFAGTCTGSS